MSTQTRKAIRPSALAVALLAIYAPAQAADVDEVTEQSKPESTVSAGFGYITDDNQRFGQYTNLRDQGGYGLLDLNLVNRNDDTVTWITFDGRNLGLDNRELRFEHTRQGDWGYFLDFSQTPRYEPYTVNTAVTGIGTPNLTIPTASTAGSDVQLKTKREAIGLGANKYFLDHFDVQVRYRSEQKDGARLFARGTPGAFEFAPEPINSTTRQLEATLGYTGKQLQLSGGYYGTLYDNHNTALNFTGGAAGLATFTPIALPPGNQSHQLFLTGGYSFTPTTRGTFKLAYAEAIQNDAFITGVNVPLAPGIGNDLGGRVDTTLAQVGLTARPLPKLSLLANLRYENRDDKTPVLRYNTLAGPTSTFNGDNEPRSIKTTAGKVEATYRLPADLRLTGGIDYEEKERNASPVRIVSHRDTTDETSYRAELRRSMSETITGAVSYIRSNRGGSDFLNTVLNDGTAGSNLIAPITLADRERDKVRLMVNWTPIEALNLQLMADSARDDYSARTDLDLGPRSGEAENVSLDTSYVFSEAWQVTAWISRNDNRVEQASRTSGAQLWAAALRNMGDTFGLGLRSRPTSKLELGVDLQQSRILDEFRQTAISGAAIGSPPDITTRLTSVKLFAQYALQKNAGVRLNYAYERWQSDDWTWTTWTYTDGTRVFQDPTQKVHFIGISGYYRWW